MLKTKFEFNYLQNALFIHQPGSPRQSITKTFTTNWGSPGFILEPANHWITFTIYPNKIRAFYKQVIVPEESLWSLEQINYYQKDLELNKNPITFTFEPTDEVQKLNGNWVKKSN